MADPDAPIPSEKVLAGFQAFGRGDWRFVQRLLAPDCRWEENNLGGFPGLDAVYVGPEGFEKWMKDTREAWDAIESRVEEIVQVESLEGPSFVVATRLCARGRQNIELDMVLFNVLWTRNAEMVVRRRIYFNREEALVQAALADSEIGGSDAGPQWGARDAVRDDKQRRAGPWTERSRRSGIPGIEHALAG